MELQRSGIIFDNPHNTYFAGDTVSGKIVLILDKPTKAKGVSLHVKGEATVRWTVHTGSTTIIFYAREEYFQQRHYCVGGRDEEPITLPVGTHVYPFSCPLPPSLPSSFEGPYGKIRHSVKYVVERPWKTNRTTKVIFTVVSPYDLNLFSSLMDPVTLSEEKYSCCCCCRSKALSAVMKIPKLGYVSGERIPIIIDVDNASKKPVSSVTVRLQQATRFYSQHPFKDSRKDTKIFEVMKLGSVDGNNSKVWNVTLPIPPLPPSSLGYCAIIDSQYQLYLEISIGTFHVNLTTYIPITIGTVPAIGNGPPHDIAPPPDYETATASSGGMGGAPVQVFRPNEAFGAKSIEEDDDDGGGDRPKSKGDPQGYTPYFPTYNFNYNG